MLRQRAAGMAQAVVADGRLPAVEDTFQAVLQRECRLQGEGIRQAGEREARSGRLLNPRPLLLVWKERPTGCANLDGQHSNR